MRQILKIGALSITWLIFVSENLFAADSEQIGRRIDNSQIMERVALVGVIAGGSAASGVAVIKDNRTGKTYAIKTGDNLPGVGHIKLQSVRREVAVFNADGKEFQVKLSIGGYSQEAEDDEDLLADVDKTEGPGLFEKWSSEKLTGEPINNSINKYHNNPDQISENETSRNEPMVIEVGSSSPNDDSKNLRKDKDGPVAEFLDKLTESNKNFKKGKINTARKPSSNGEDPSKSSVTVD